jgi:hypothetical protein
MGSKEIELTDVTSDLINCMILYGKYVNVLPANTVALTG